MKKTMTLFIIIVSLILFTGCSGLALSQGKADDSVKAPSKGQEEMKEKGSEGEEGDQKDTDEEPIDEDTTDEEITTDEKVRADEGIQDKVDTEGQEEVSDYKIDSGRYSGRIDNNFIEIKISGVPEELSYKTFMLSEELKAEFDSLNLQTDDAIKFKYKLNEHDQGVIFEISEI